MPNIKLTYFGLTGVAEPLRYILSHSNQKFEDVRFSFEEWPAKKPSFPLGKLPLLEMDGKKFIQSVAMCRYFAKQNGLAGKNDMENFAIDSIVDTICDLRTACASYFWDQLPASKESKKQPLQKETVPTYMNYLEKMAKENGGHLALGKLTWADFFLAATVGYMNHATEIDVLKDTPTLKALVDKVKGLPGIKEYLANSPKPAF